MGNDAVPPATGRAAVKGGVCKRGIGTTKDLLIRNGRVMHSRCFQTLLDKILQFLSHRQGEAFCAQCVAQGLSVAVSKVQSVILKIEARGARRHDGRCSGCGKQRLVATVNQGRASGP